jgi:hypothetical protein
MRLVMETDASVEDLEWLAVENDWGEVMQMCRDELQRREGMDDDSVVIE